MAGLVDLQQFSEQYSGVKHILMVIDILSKPVQAISLKRYKGF